MSAFQCNITPTRIKAAKKVNENREPSIVILGPFTPKCIVIFEDVPVTKTARRFLVVKNPVQQDLEVQVSKSPRSDYNLSLEWTSTTIPANGEVSMELVWIPTKVEGCRENLQLSDQFGNKKDIAIVLKSVELKKITKRSTNPLIAIPKKLKLKSPSPPRSFIKRSVITKKSTWSTMEIQVENSRSKKPIEPSPSPLTERNLNNASNIFSANPINYSAIDDMFENNENKENVASSESPSTPQASTLFDNIKFTPATETKTRSTSKLEYLASLPTPCDFNRGSSIVSSNTVRRNLVENGISPEVSETRRKSLSKFDTPSVSVPAEYSVGLSNLETPFPVKHNLASIPEHIVETPQAGSDRFLPNLMSTASRMKPQTITVLDENVRKELDMSTTDIGSETYVKTEIDEFGVPIVEENIILSQTHRVEVLTAISEESQKNAANFQKTFSVKSLSEDDVFAVAQSPATKKILSESMRECESNRSENNRKNSLPNISDFVRPMENQYYLQPPKQDDINLSMESIVSTSEFQDCEINAQSSRFNINEIGLPKQRTQSEEDESKYFSPKTRHRKLSDSPILASSPNLRRVLKQDTTFKSPLRKNQQMMTFSPPKPRRIHTDVMEKFERDGACQMGREIRVSTWKQQKSQNVVFQVPKAPTLPLSRPIANTQQHSISLTSLASNVSSNSAMSAASLPITPRKYRGDHVSIYNPEHHLIGDPFAATTTCDPFLSSSMYLDEKSVDRIEKQFKKWLNALVTIPAELDSDENMKIDVAKLFQEAQGKELKLAPTKEVVSSKYYKTRIDSLRCQAVNFYKTPEITVPMQKVARQIEDQGISIRTDRNIQLDLVLQRHILELLLCYNPLWLRIGLEVVFGVQLDLNSNHDILGLSRFIINRMFKDPYLEQKYGKNFKKSEELSKQMKKHQLKKFLFVIFFLDRAKESHLIKHNPCLFVKKAPFKESIEILKRFASLVLANFGDIVKQLKRFGYILTHKQVYIDEFDYAFSNLAIDLRDGVRLTKVMEVILMRDDLTKKVRSPAISRLQKIHNVEVALKALAEAEYQIMGEITPKDIADGHREKTLSLLWQIIYKFRAPKFNAAATTIQRWWRSLWLKVVIDRRIQIKHEIRINSAANLIQKVYRGYFSRKMTKNYILERKWAAVVIQKWFRGRQARKEAKLQLNAIVKVQKWWQSVQTTRKVRLDYLKLKSTAVKIQVFYRRILLARKLEASAQIIKSIKAEAKDRHGKACLIQKTFKSYLIKKKLINLVCEVVKFNHQNKLEYKSASKIQATWKMVKCQREFLKVKTVVIHVQKLWRAKLLARKERMEFLELRTSTMKIQEWYRGLLLMRKQRETYLREKASIVRMQEKYKAKLQGRWQRQKFMKLKNSTILVQRQFRANKQMEIERQNYQNLRQSAIKIQRKVRAHQHMKIERHSYLELKEKVTFVQQTFRAKKIRNEFLQLRQTVIFVQQKFRANLAMKKQRIEYVKTVCAISTIQIRFRAQIEMKKQRAEYLNLKNAAKVLQDKFRAKKKMEVQRNEYHNLKRVTIKIQQKFRATKLMRKQYLNYCSLQYYTTIVQQKYRGLVLMRRERQNYLKLRDAVIKVQRRFRGRIQTKIDNEKFVQLKKAVLCVQERRRGLVQMRKERKQFLKVKNAAEVVQIRYRALRLMQEQRAKYFKLKKSVLVVESRFLAKKEMISQKNRYQEMRNAAVALQNRYRAVLLARKVRQEFIVKKTAVVKIQNYFRGYLAMKKEVAEFRTTRNAVLKIQEAYKAHQFKKQHRTEFLKIKKSVILIQTVFRSYMQMKIQRNRYLTIRQSIIKIQKRFREYRLMKMERKEFLTLKEVTVKVQTKWRATLEMRKERENYLRVQQSTKVIQQRLRANLLMRKVRTQFTVQKSSATSIQRVFRGYLEMKRLRNEFLTLRTSTIFIQQKFRANKIGKQERENFLIMKASAITIQTTFRGYLVMKDERQKFLQLKQTVVLVQKRFREKLETRRLRNEFLLHKAAAIKIQRKWRATLEMRAERPQYLKLKKAAIAIQKYYRCRIEAKKQREEFLGVREACLVIQRRFRAQKLMQLERENYLKMKSAVVTLENSYISWRLMKAERTRYLELKKSAIFVQKIFRRKLEAQKTRKSYLKMKETVVQLQSRVRGFLARKAYQKMTTPEALLERKRYRAARVIQAFWRGYYARKKHQTRNLKEIAKRLMKVNQNLDPSQTLQIKIQLSIQFLRGSYNANEAYRVLIRMEYISRITPHLLIPHAFFVSSFCYGLMGQAIRSEIDKQIIELCSCIILNLGRYKYTRSDAFQETGLSTVSQMLLRWCDKDCGIFNTLCTFIYVFAHCEHHKKKIRQFMTTNRDANYILHNIQQLVARKEKMRQNSKRPLGFTSVSLQAYKKEKQFLAQQQVIYGLQNLHDLPALEPDYGIIKAKPYIFYSSVFAFETILSKLDIHI